MTNNKITKKEEQTLVRLAEHSDEWTPVGPLVERKAFWRAVAEHVIEGKRRRISIAVNEDDLARLRSESLRTGIPYQTIINSLIRMHVRNEE